MSIMDIFKPKPVETPAPTSKPVEPGNLPAAEPIVDPAKPAAAATELDKPTSPLDQFKDMWEPNLDAEGKPVVDAPTPTALDPAKLQEVIKKADFTKSLSQEDLAAITAGGDGAATALANVMNNVAQQTLMQSTLATNKMVEQAIEAATKAAETRVAEQIRASNLSNNLLEANPIYNNPAVKPVIEAVQAQLAVKNPTASTAELAEMAQGFVKAMGESLTGVKPGTTEADKSNASGDTDWEDLFGVKQA